MRLHHAHSLLEVVIHLAASRVRGVRHLLSSRLVLELSFREVLIIGGLFEIDLLGEQLLLSQLVCSGSLAVVARASERSLGLPVGSRGECNLGRLSVDTDRLIVDVAASKDTGLQVLVLAILAVETLSLQWRAAVIDCAHIWVLPVNALSHQRAVVLRVLVGSECLSGRPVKLLVHLHFGRDMSLRLQSRARRPFDLFVG